MKRWSALVVPVLLVVAVSLASPLAVAAQQTIRVGADTAFPPFEFVDEKTGAYTGFDMELIRAIGEVMGVEVEIVNTVFDGLIPALLLGEFDVIISAMTITEERAQTVAFSDPYFVTGLVIATRPDETSIQSTEDLKGKTVAVQMGSTGHFAAADLPGVGRVDPYQFVDQAMTAVIIGAADAAILDELVAIEYMRAHPDAIKVVGGPFTTEEYGIAVRPQETELLAKINAALAELRASGRYDELYDKWFGVD